MQKFAQQLVDDTLRRLLPQLFSDFANSIQRPFKTAAATIIAKRGSSQASKACTIVPNQHHHHSQKNLLRRDLNQTFKFPSCLYSTTGECIIYIIANVSIKISDSRNGHKNSYDREKYYNKIQPPTTHTTMELQMVYTHSWDGSEYNHPAQQYIYSITLYTFVHSKSDGICKK